MFMNLFKKTVQKNLLGRWERTSDTMNTIKVNWANIDHCGTCINEAKLKSNESNKIIKNPRMFLPLPDIKYKNIK